MFSIPDWCNNVYITFHKNPDGDALGSALALLRIIKKKYPKINVQVLSDVDFKIGKMIERYSIGDIAKSSDIPEKSFLYIVDHSDEIRSCIKEWGHPHIFEKRVIDHHLNTEWKKLGSDEKHYIDPEGECTAMMIYNHLMATESHLMDKDIATLLLIGIYGDSCKFSILPNKSESLKAWWDLIYIHGADYEFIKKTSSRSTYQKERQLGYIFYFSTWKSINHKYVKVKLTYEQYKKMYENYVKTDDIFAKSWNLDCLDTCILNFEYKPKRWIISIRSKDTELIATIKKEIPEFNQLLNVQVNSNVLTDEENEDLKNSIKRVFKNYYQKLKEKVV